MEVLSNRLDSRLVDLHPFKRVSEEDVKGTPSID